MAGRGGRCWGVSRCRAAALLLFLSSLFHSHSPRPAESVVPLRVRWTCGSGGRCWAGSRCRAADIFLFVNLQMTFSAQACLSCYTGALDGWQRRQVLGRESLPGGWEAARVLGKSLADEMALRAITLTGGGPTTHCKLENVKPDQSVLIHILGNSLADELALRTVTLTSGVKTLPTSWTLSSPVGRCWCASWARRRPVRWRCALLRSQARIHCSGTILMSLLRRILGEALWRW